MTSQKDLSVKPDLKPGQEVATLAGGCFWGMEDLVRKLPGVVDTEVGYTGGHTPNPTYLAVKHGDTGHAETLQVIFEPAKISFEEILKFYFRMHDPTTANRQGNDIGTQYRSAIFYHSEAQRETAEKMKKFAETKWGKPVVTEIVPVMPFYRAEEFHQDYLERYPEGYTCHWLREW